jgi:hypothetical protein
VTPRACKATPRQVAASSKAELDRAVAELKVWGLASLIAVAGLAITIAKLV